MRVQLLSAATLQTSRNKSSIQKGQPSLKDEYIYAKFFW